MRLAAYAGASVVLATGVFLKALHQRSNFYSACVYLSQSSANLMILTNLCLLATGFVLFWLQRLLYGPLRPIETEQLYERAWFAVTETCLAMTIFRGSLGGWFLVMFISLLVGKVWGWIGEGRVEYLEQQPPANPRLFHTRLAVSLVLSILFNASMLRYCVNTVYHQAKPDMMVMFGFEFAILTILSTSTTARYCISLTELYITRQQVKAKMEERRAEIREARLEAIRAHARAGEGSPPTNLPDENDVNELEIDVPGWEEKGRWVFYLDLLTDFVKLIVYLVFFAILLTFYGLPIHILRDVVVTIRSFGRRIMDFIRYRNATRDMNERYPDATAEEVGREEVCIICREDMVSAQPAPDAGQNNGQPAAGNARAVPDRLRPKKLPCGHILHFACLRSWLERQQNCPTCRRPVVGPGSTQGSANANAPGNGVGQQQNGAGGDQAPGQVGGQGEGAPRARVYQFGPFRVGFGAVRGDLFQNLHNQIHQGNAPLQPAPDANPPGARQIGFGFGFGRRPPVAEPTHTQSTATHSNTADIPTQLRQIEQQLAQEIESLRLASEQLIGVRGLQLELERLRLQQQANGFAQQAATSGVFSMPQVPPTPTIPHMPHAPLNIPHLPNRRPVIINPGAESIPAGDPRIPEGMTIPPGWTLTPWHPVNPGAGSAGPSQGLSPTPTTSGHPASVAPSNEPNASQGPTTQETSHTESNVINDTSTSTHTEAATSDALPSLTSQALPSWGSQNTSTEDPRTDSLSQEWTDVRPDQVADASSSTIATGSASTEHDSQSEPKAKGRAATVEETVDEEAS
ncbi:hypothetical protein N7493_006703 [Penicillium malachiteum]|uniref:RING-type E3 ubiquitin transferase n=1 Tax=Penicillium malachiteum TaxID=1324776 RepID=A0AAD6HJD8_9EURO|nr:hypothetical protein N7493_006703 [Penicillium malachiteum]